MSHSLPANMRSTSSAARSADTCIAGVVDRAGEKDPSQTRYANSPPCTAGPLSIDVGGVIFGGLALLNFLAGWPRRCR